MLLSALQPTTPITKIASASCVSRAVLSAPMQILAACARQAIPSTPTPMGMLSAFLSAHSAICPLHQTATNALHRANLAAVVSLSVLHAWMATSSSKAANALLPAPPATTNPQLKICA